DPGAVTALTLHAGLMLQAPESIALPVCLNMFAPVKYRFAVLPGSICIRPPPELPAYPYSPHAPAHTHLLPGHLANAPAHPARHTPNPARFSAPWPTHPTRSAPYRPHSPAPDRRML